MASPSLSLTPRLRFIIWMAILASVVTMMTVAVVDRAGTETTSERIGRLNESFACPTCDGETVAESNAAVSATIRQYIADRVDEGASDEAIRNELLVAYGTEVLTNPPAEGFASLVWILPVVAVLLGVVVLGFVFRRHRAGDREPTDEDHRLADMLRNRVMANQTEEHPGGDRRG